MKCVFARPSSSAFSFIICTKESTSPATSSASAAAASLALFTSNPYSKSCTLITLSLIHISEPTRLRRISYAVFCLKKKKKKQRKKKTKLKIKKKKHQNKKKKKKN